MLVAFKQKRYALGIVFPGFLATYQGIRGIDCRVELLVCLEQRGRHGQRVVQVGQAAAGELGAGFSAMTFAVFMGYAALAASGRNALLASETAMRWLRRLFAASFAALGLKLAVARA